MASKVFPCFICVFVLLALFSLECEAFIVTMPHGKLMFLRKSALPVSKAILKLLFTQAAYCLQQLHVTVGEAYLYL